MDQDGKLRTRVDALIEEYQSNHYTKYLQGKKVVVVGPNTQLKDKGLGKQIDQFPVVVRHNTVFEYLPFIGVNRKFAQDYGTRTNILYLAPQCIKDYSFKRETIVKLKNLRDQFGLRFLVYQNGNKDGHYLTEGYCFPKHLDWFKQQAAKLKISMHYSHHTARELTRLMVEEANSCGGCDLSRLVVPRVGFISIFDLLIHQAQEIEILGMSFYHGGGHAFRRQALTVLDPLKNAYGSNSGCHDSVIELELLHQLVKLNQENNKYSLIKYQFPSS